MKITGYVAVLAISLSAVGSAHAATLDWSITADNAFSLYLSSSPATAGTLIYSNLGLTAAQWGTAFTGSVSVSGTEYINIVTYNYTSSNGLWSTPGTPYGGDNPEALIGSFTLSSGTFLNGTNSLVTNTADWTAINVLPPNPDVPSTAPNPAWQTPTGTPVSFGPNGVGPWGSISGISSDAQWIGAANASPYEYADFSTSLDPSPLPGALPLLAGGLAVFFFFGWRRRRQANAFAVA
jgi:hypothetical protein